MAERLSIAVLLLNDSGFGCCNNGAVYLRIYIKLMSYSLLTYRG